MCGGMFVLVENVLCLLWVVVGVCVGGVGCSGGFLFELCWQVCVFVFVIGMGGKLGYVSYWCLW